MGIEPIVRISLSFMDMCFSDFSMIRWTEVFSKVIGQVSIAFLPMHIELALGFSILQLTIPHVDRFGSLLLCFLVDKANSGAIIYLHRSWRLWMVKFYQGITNWDGFLTIGESGCYFNFSRRAHEDVKNLANDVHGAIDGCFVWVHRIVTEKEACTSPAASLKSRKTGSIAVCLENHITLIASHSSIWARRQVIQ